MPIMRLKQPFDAVSGTFGSPTGPDVVAFATAKNPGVIRKWLKPFNPNTYLQIKARQALTAASQAWTALSGAQAQAWNDAAALYVQLNRLALGYKISGINLFVRVNAYRALDAQAVTQTPPTDLIYAPQLESGGSVSIVSGNGAHILVQVTVGSTAVTTHAKRMLLEIAGPVLSTSRKLRRNDFRQWDDTVAGANVVSCAQAGSGTVSTQLDSTTREVESGSILAISYTPLSAEYVPGPATIYKRTVA